MRIFLLLPVLIVAACASTSGTPLPGANRDASATYYVENHGEDERHLEDLIAEVLRARGLDAMGGSAAERPPSATYLVRYIDRWYWDMRMYLIDFTIEVRDPQTNKMLGFGQSYQDSLAAMGMTYRDVIERAVDELLARPDTD